MIATISNHELATRHRHGTMGCGGSARKYDAYEAAHKEAAAEAATLEAGRIIMVTLNAGGWLVRVNDGEEWLGMVKGPYHPSLTLWLNKG